MGETITLMNVPAARQRLQNTRGLSSEQSDEAQKVIDAFRAQRPVNRQCPACHSMLWSEHETASGGASWACSGCHRSADLTPEAWHAQQTAAREAADAHLKATEAAAPKPRAHLREALTRLADSRKALERLERAAPIARAAASEAQDRVDAAEVAAEGANEGAAADLAASFLGGKPGPAPSASSARAELAAAVDARIVTRNAKTILDGKVADARSAVGFASDRARKAARGVIAAELLEQLLTAATALPS